MFSAPIREDTTAQPRYRLHHAVPSAALISVFVWSRLCRDLLSPGVRGRLPERLHPASKSFQAISTPFDSTVHRSQRCCGEATTMCKGRGSDTVVNGYHGVAQPTTSPASFVKADSCDGESLVFTRCLLDSLWVCGCVYRDVQAFCFPRLANRGFSYVNSARSCSDQSRTP